MTAVPEVCSLLYFLLTRSILTRVRVAVQGSVLREPPMWACSVDAGRMLFVFGSARQGKGYAFMTLRRPEDRLRPSGPRCTTRPNFSLPKKFSSR